MAISTAPFGLAFAALAVSVAAAPHRRATDVVGFTSVGVGQFRDTDANGGELAVPLASSSGNLPKCAKACLGHNQQCLDFPAAPVCSKGARCDGFEFKGNKCILQGGQLVEPLTKVSQKGFASYRLDTCGNADRDSLPLVPLGYRDGVSDDTMIAAPCRSGSTRFDGCVINVDLCFVYPTTTSSITATTTTQTTTTTATSSTKTETSSTATDTSTTTATSTTETVTSTTATDTSTTATDTSTTATDTSTTATATSTTETVTSTTATDTSTTATTATDTSTTATDTSTTATATSTTTTVTSTTTVTTATTHTHTTTTATFGLNCENDAPARVDICAPDGLFLNGNELKNGAAAMDVAATARIETLEQQVLDLSLNNGAAAMDVAATARIETLEQQVLDLSLRLNEAIDNLAGVELLTKLVAKQVLD